MRIWSDVEYVYRCLADVQRTLAFEKAINAIVKAGDVVLDLGTGSGIMALFAAKAGARKIYAVEIGDYLSRASKEIVNENGYGERISVLRMDACDLTLQHVEKPNAVICEMITTGLLGEMQGHVIRALKNSGIIDKSTLLIPGSLDIRASIVQIEYGFLGFKMRFPLFVDYFTHAFDRSFQVLSDEVFLHKVDFSEDFSESIHVQAQFKMASTGTANGLLIQSRTQLSRQVELQSCISYCQPVIVPIPDLRVHPEDTARLSLMYSIGQGFDSLQCDLQLEK